MALASLFKRKKPRKTTARRQDVVKAETSKPAALVSSSLTRRVVLTPLVSEKGVERQALNQVMFRVSRTATKGQITQAVQEQYGVKPVKVRTVRMHPKRRRRGRSEGFTSMWKKVYISVTDLKPFNVTP